MIRALRGSETSALRPLWLAVVLACTAHPGLAQQDQEEKVRDAIEVLHEIMEIPEASIPETLLQEAHAIAVIPRVVKVGFVLGGRRGRGVLMIRREDGAWSNPSFVVLTGGSVGWQIGAQSADVVLIFKSQRGVDRLVDGTYTLGADAAVAAGPVGRQAQAATDAPLQAEIYSYSRSRGAFAGLSIEGSSIRISDRDNRAFYDRTRIRREDVFFDERLETPPAAQELREAVSRYTRREAAD